MRTEEGKQFNSESTYKYTHEKNSKKPFHHEKLYFCRSFIDLPWAQYLWSRLCTRRKRIEPGYVLHDSDYDSKFRFKCWPTF